MSKVDSIQIPVFGTDGPGYEADFNAWLDEQSRRLRLLRIPGVDTDNLAEEIESLGRRDRNEIASRIEVLLSHLLKWKYQPSHRGTSWKLTIREQRKEIATTLADSPSLRRMVPGAVASSYRGAVEVACEETGIANAVFPLTCEWDPELVLQPGFLPED